MFLCIMMVLGFLLLQQTQIKIINSMTTKMIEPINIDYQIILFVSPQTLLIQRRDSHSLSLIQLAPLHKSIFPEKVQHKAKFINVKKLKILFPLIFFKELNYII